MASYTAGTSDKSKSRALSLFLKGGFGMLGLHYFYVGKYKRGIVHIVATLFALVIIFGIMFDNTDGAPIPMPEKLGITAMVLVVCFLANARTFVAIKSGTFRDNVGAPLREQ